MATAFADCCVRYGQEFLYTTFSESNMTLGEIYMSLTYGLIDPTCLPSMAIIHYDNKIWSTDTRRLTLAKELERRGRFDILQLLHVQEVKQNTPQYTDFVKNRLPAMQRKGLDGLTIKVSDRRGPTCCFNGDNRFRADLEEHIIQDHLKNFTLELFKNLTVYYCDLCKKTTRITCTKSTNRSYYTIIRKCGCKPKKPHRCAQPWSRLTFKEMCHELLHYNHSVKRTVITEKATTRSSNIDSKSPASTIDSQITNYETTKTTVASQLFDSDCEHQSDASARYNKLTDHRQKQRELKSSTKLGTQTIETYKESTGLVPHYNKTQKSVDANYQRKRSCCEIS